MVAFKMSVGLAIVFSCLVGAALSQENVTALEEEQLVAKETLDDVHISCKSLLYMLPEVSVISFQDDVINGTNLTDIFSLNNKMMENETESMNNVTIDTMVDSNKTANVSDDKKFDSDLDVPVPPGYEETMMKLEGVGFPFDISCVMSGQDAIEVSVSSKDNITQIVEVMAQVFVNGSVSGQFEAPEASQDYQTHCSDQAVTQTHNDAKESFRATWMQSNDTKNDTSATCVYSILDTNGNFWHMVMLPATDMNATSMAASEDEQEKGDVDEDVEFTATDFNMAEETPEDTKSEMTGVSTTVADNSTATSEEKGMEDQEEMAEGKDSMFKAVNEDMGDMGQIAVDGETYNHHCINNNMIRVLVPYTGCSDFLTVVGGLPRSYQSCGQDNCFDVEACDCKECSQVTCDKLTPGTTQTYSIRIYNAEGKEVGTVSGQRTRTVTGGLTESISAQGDPRSELFPIDI